MNSIKKTHIELKFVCIRCYAFAFKRLINLSSQKRKKMMNNIRFIQELLILQTHLRKLEDFSIEINN